MPAYVLVMVIFTASMGLWAFAAAFWPRPADRENDGDDAEPALVTRGSMPWPATAA